LGGLRLDSVIALAAGLAAQGQGNAAAACEAPGTIRSTGRHSVGDAAGLAFIESLVLFTVRDDLPESTVME